MTLAELLLFAIVIAAIYSALSPLRRAIERKLLSWMGRSPHRAGQGPVYRMKRED